MASSSKQSTDLASTGVSIRLMKVRNVQFVMDRITKLGGGDTSPAFATWTEKLQESVVVTGLDHDDKNFARGMFSIPFSSGVRSTGTVFGGLIAEGAGGDCVGHLTFHTQTFSTGTKCCNINSIASDTRKVAEEMVSMVEGSLQSMLSQEHPEATVWIVGDFAPDLAKQAGYESSPIVITGGKNERTYNEWSKELDYCQGITAAVDGDAALESNSG